MASDRIVEAIPPVLLGGGRRALIGGRSNAAGVWEGSLSQRVFIGKLFSRYFNELRSGILIPHPVLFEIKDLVRGAGKFWEESPESLMPSASEASHLAGKFWESSARRQHPIDSLRRRASGTAGGLED